MTKLESLIEDFDKSLLRLEEVIKLEKSDIVRDAAIQRFEMAFDLCWKTLKAFLEERHNISCFSPRSCFKEAFHQKLIQHDDFWIELTSFRNYTTHTYNEKIADKVYGILPKTIDYLKNFIDKIKENIS